MNSAQKFVTHALTTRFSDLPPEAVRAAKTFILDTIGVGIAGRRAPLADDVFGAVSNWGAGEGAHVFGRQCKLPTLNAAFVNGFQIHCQEYDCVHETAVVHPLATILSSLLAVADERGNVAGKEFIAAVAVAVDIAAGLGVAAKSGIRFFRPANAGIFGAALGIARLREFSEQQALDALGYALAFCSGTMQAHVEGKPALPLQIANAARGAVAACDISAAGVPGPNDVIDGPFGYLQLFETETDIAPVLQSLGKVWRIAEVSHKPFPTGRAAQGGIVAVQKLRDLGATPESIEKLTLTAPPLIHRLVGRPYRHDMTANYARLCFAYCGAVTLANGAVGLEDFSAERLADPDIALTAQKISVIDDGSSDPAAFTPQFATALLKNGESLKAEVRSLYGSPADPLTETAHIEKFRRCVRFGLGDHSGDCDQKLIEIVEELEMRADVSILSRLAAGMQE